MMVVLTLQKAKNYSQLVRIFSLKIIGQSLYSKVGKSVITISFFVEKVILARKHDTPVFVGKKNITFRGLKTWVNLTHVIYGDKPVLSLQ